MSDYITEDTLVLIFTRLAAKSLLRFRSVCKGWKELIDSPFFIQEHLSVQKPRFLLLDEGRSLQDPRLPSVSLLATPFEDKQLLFCGTHHGLVCLFDESKKAKIPNKLIVWNPSIHKALAVLIPDRSRCGWAYDACLNWFGFWVDPSTKEYKFIVLILLLEREYLEGYDRVILGMDARLYSSARPETHNWMPIKSPEEAIGNVVLCPPVMIQGVAHWVGNRYEDNARIILSFDFAVEKLDTIDIPDHLQYASTQLIHCHWQGKLSLLADDLSTCCKYDLFLRQEEAWVKMFSFKFYPNFGRIRWLVGEKEERFIVLAGNPAQWSFYFSRGGVIHLHQKVFVAYDFVESLLFP